MDKSWAKRQRFTKRYRWLTITLLLKFGKALKLFGEDKSDLKPDVFFGIFDTFIMAFAEAKQDNKNMAKKKEEEEKRALIEAQVRTGLDKKEGKHTYMSVQNP